jgi:hypothetical protein
LSSNSDAEVESVSGDEVKMGKKDSKKKSHKKEKKRHHSKSAPAQVKKRVKKSCTSSGTSSGQRKALLQVNKSLGVLQKKLSKVLGN